MDKPLTIGDNLILIDYLRRVASQRGFHVPLSGNGSDRYAEIHEGLDGEPVRATGAFYEGCAYSCADYVISDGKKCTYPFTSEHPGYAKRSDYGVKKLLSHPRMEGI